MHNLVLAGCALVGLGALYRSNTNPHDWARDEAEERRRRRAEGKEVVYGVNYAGISQLKAAGLISEEEAAELEAGKLEEPRPLQISSSRAV